MQPPPLPKPAGVAAVASRILPKNPSGPPPPPLLLNLQELERFENLLVFARATVEGYFSGKHKSPYRGSAAEFADYKEYVAGDDLARLDWRVYGRTRRLYIRRYEEETDMTVYLMVDTSGSMRYAGEKRQSKFFLAAKIAAALAYLMMAQADKAALVLFAKKVSQFLTPGGTRRHLHRLVTELERVKPAQETGIAQAVSECNALFKKRGRIVILSDFLDETPALFDALSQFVHRKFEILLLQVTDPDELNLPAFNAAKFVDLETAETVQVDPEEIRVVYQQRVQQSIDDLAREADVRQIQHRLIDTRRPYVDAIEAYLGFRGKNEQTR
ncbi:MAG TPA: DUF58 domain-containing protein [Chthoniobacteraceae bacterium]|jgi:uncharacterized protein (DUF58 family)|nr:DUF58 domain-containing protein [Chthoniobacteraceae bacterium]